jgi:Zn-dependent peptidase ImmA (M78 family)
MKWVPDKTGRFARRPHYLPEEIDTQCERLIQKFLSKKYGKVEFPIRTDDLTILIEERADLDSATDLSHEQGEVEGVTEFRRGERPLVSISQSLSAPNMENRLRTTLTHEFGHVYFHHFMFETETQSGLLFPAEPRSQVNKCNRASIVNAVETDWMEWQAGYACGAILMPVGALIAKVQAFRAENDLEFSNLVEGSEAGQALIGRVAADFQTSKDAARVRLLKRGTLTGGDRRIAEMF